MLQIINIIKKLLVGLSVVFIGIALILIYQSKNSTISTFMGYSYATIVSDSMSPSIMVGDFLIYKKEDSYEVNDIVMYMVNDVSITHRIIEINSDGYITKGDNNNVSDEVILNSNEIIGKIIYQTNNITGELIFYISILAGIIVILVVAEKLINKNS